MADPNPATLQTQKSIDPSLSGNYGTQPDRDATFLTSGGTAGGMNLNVSSMQQSVMMRRTSAGMSVVAGHPNAPKEGGGRGKRGRNRWRRARRWGYWMVVAIIRMRRACQTHLTQKERHWFSRMYYSHGAMREFYQIAECLSLNGINAGREEMERVLKEKAWFVEGRVLEHRQFLLLGKYLKTKFTNDQAVPDSHVAFVALGGEADLEGDVSADDLRGVCSSFQLTIDIEAFLREHDSDGSGKLEFSEFNNMFKEEDQSNNGGSDGRLESKEDGPRIGAGSGQPPVVIKRANSSEDLADLDAEAPTTAAAIPSPAKQRQTQQQQHEDEQTVLSNVDNFIQNDDLNNSRFPSRSPEERRRRKHNSTRKKASSKTAKADSGNDSGEIDRNAPPEEDEEPQRKPLHERGGEAEARERLQLIKARASKPEAPGFGSSRRFEHEEPLAPLPKKKKLAREKLPPLPNTSRPSKSQRREQKWDEVNPFLQSSDPVKSDSPAAASKTPRLPAIARTSDGRKHMVQPQFMY